MGRKIVVIDGHPDPDPQRFCHALAAAYQTGAAEAGHHSRLIEVAKLDFAMLRTAADFETGDPPPAIAEAQKTIAWADHLVIIYPLWLGAMPALLKGFFEQSFRPGFGFEHGKMGWPKKLLGGRSARVIITMGMPGPVFRWYFRSHSLKTLERNILRFGGIGPIRDTLFGMVEAVSQKRRSKWLKQMTEMGREGV